MAHFARIENGVVREVVVVNNDTIDPANEEASGQAFLADSGFTGEWVQTFYSGTPRTFAGVGDLWDGTDFTPPPQTPDTSST